MFSCSFLPLLFFLSLAFFVPLPNSVLFYYSFLSILVFLSNTFLSQTLYSPFSFFGHSPLVPVLLSFPPYSFLFFRFYSYLSLCCLSNLINFPLINLFLSFFPISLCLFSLFTFALFLLSLLRLILVYPLLSFLYLNLYFFSFSLFPHLYLPSSSFPPLSLAYSCSSLSIFSSLSLYILLSPVYLSNRLSLF